MAVDAMGRVIVGSGHFSSSVSPPMIEGAARIVVGSAQHLAFGMKVADAFFTTVKNTPENDAVRDRAVENLQRLTEAGIDIGKALGWGAAGDYDQAMQSAVDAGQKMLDVFVRGFEGK